jgi:hypothetical protein
MPPSQGASSIALFMLLAVVMTPEPPPGGVGLRGVVDARAKGQATHATLNRPAAVRPMAAAPGPLPAQIPSCEGPLARAETDPSRGGAVAGVMPPSCVGSVRPRAAGVAPELAK